MTPLALLLGAAAVALVVLVAGLALVARERGRRQRLRAERDRSTERLLWQRLDWVARPESASPLAAGPQPEVPQPAGREPVPERADMPAAVPLMLAARSGSETPRVEVESASFAPISMAQTGVAPAIPAPASVASGERADQSGPGEPGADRRPRDRRTCRAGRDVGGSSRLLAAPPPLARHVDGAAGGWSRRAGCQLRGPAQPGAGKRRPGGHVGAGDDGPGRIDARGIDACDIAQRRRGKRSTDCKADAHLRAGRAGELPFGRPERHALPDPGSADRDATPGSRADPGPEAASDPGPDREFHAGRDHAAPRTHARGVASVNARAEPHVLIAPARRLPESHAHCYTRAASPGSRTTVPERAWGYFALFSEIGLVLLVTILVGVLGGYWVDQQLRTLPIFILVGFLAGLGAGTRAVYRLISGFLATFDD